MWNATLGWNGLNGDLESSSSEKLNNVERETSSTIFELGNGKGCHSIEPVTILVVIAGENVFLTTEVFENDIPLCWAANQWKRPTAA